MPEKHTTRFALWGVPTVRWVGIDEAGYGPNLGPLVMTAVSAELDPALDPASDVPAELELWGDLASSVDRAGGDPRKLWVDDSKAVHRARDGRDRLEIGCLAVIDAARGTRPGSFAELVGVLGPGLMDELELEPWKSAGAMSSYASPRWQGPETAAILDRCPLTTLDKRWRIVGVDVAAVSPARFNEGLTISGSKASVHFEAFARLLRIAWEREPTRPTRVVSDIHGGRRYYLEPLAGSFPEVWIERGREDRRGSRYTLRSSTRSLELELRPRADATNGLVALASMVSKAIRELWMELFNAFWLDQIPGLKPTAGYPVDAARFRRAIKDTAQARGLAERIWWREK